MLHPSTLPALTGVCVPGASGSSRSRSAAANLLLWTAVASATDGPMGGAPIAEMTDSDWADFLRAALRHGMLPIAARALSVSVTEGIPPLIASDLRRAAASNSRRSLALVAELVKVLRLLDGAGIHAVPWKGPLLSQRAYGDLGSRYFFDLDVLVRAADLPRARDLLATIGFRTEKPMSAAQQAAYVEHQGELELVRDSDGVWLELHTAIVPTYYSAGTSSDDLWDRLVDAHIGRYRVPALAITDDLEALCVHGSKHRWERLIWIVDVAMMSRLLAAEDWQQLWDAARHNGTLRMVHLGLLLASDLCAAAIPSSVVRSARGDRVAVGLASEVGRDLFDPRSHRADALVFHTRMRERSVDRVRYLFNVFFTASGADWEALALPRGLFPLYALIRPLRLSLKYGRRALGGKD